MKNFVLICVIALATSIGHAAVTGTDINGVYTGSIVMIESGQEIPLQLSLQNTETDDIPDSDEFFKTKNKLEGSFVLDGESDPYSFSSADYQVDSGHFNLLAQRSSVGSSTSSASSSTTAATINGLRFEGDLQKDGSIKGTVKSLAKGIVGNFTVVRKLKTAMALTSVPKYIGRWIGFATFKNSRKIPPAPVTVANGPVVTMPPEKESITISIDDQSSQSATNPMTIETSTTPGRVGSFTDGDTLVFGFSSVVIDYLRQQIWMTFVQNAGIGNSNQSVQLTFSAKISQGGNHLDGKISSTALGASGTFYADRIPEEGVIQ